MPSKKRKYNARFPAGRIKRIMQADEEVGKIAQAVPVIISRTLELFVESLLQKSSRITVARNAKTLSPSHLKQCIMSEQRFDFLKDLVKTVPDIGEDGSAVPEDLSMEAATQSSTHNGTNASRSLLRSQSLQPSSAMPRSLSIQPAVAKPSSSSAIQRSLSVQAPPAPSSSSASGSSSNPSQYHQLQQQKFYLNNYTNHQNVTSQKPNSEPRAKISRIHSSPATATITSEQLQQKQLPAPLNFPIQISYNIDGSSSSAIDSPAVKIDYSKFTLPATSPSIKIDLSSFSQPVNSKPASSSNSLDEDYDA